MDYVAVFEALATAVRAGVTGQFCTYAFMPEDPVTPCWTVGEVDIEPNNSMRGNDSVEIRTYVYVGHGGDSLSAQKMLSRYLQRTGPYSIRAAIMGQKRNGSTGALGGLASDIGILRIQGWREYLFNEKRLYGARIDLKITGL